jgi:hypothetical protein
VEDLKTANVSGMGVRGGDESLWQLCPELTNIDLERNLLSRAEDIASVVQPLRKLKKLCISHNLIYDWNFDGVLPTVETLLAEGMQLVSLDKVSKMFPNLQSLCAPRNRLRSFPDSLVLFQLSNADFGENSFDSWEEVLKLYQSSL